MKKIGKSFLKNMMKMEMDKYKLFNLISNLIYIYILSIDIIYRI
jgi:hypothetical protein